MASRFEQVWGALDPTAETQVTWLRPAHRPRIVVLLGAFDPPTLAHLALVRGAAEATGAHGVLCFAKRTLDRPGERLLPELDRLRLLDEIAGAEGLGLAVTNRGLYLEVARAVSAAGVEAGFVIGSDKLPQLEDPSFYPDGLDGVRATFREVRFHVVPRGVPIERGDVDVLDPAVVFPRPSMGNLSATEVRKRMTEGRPIDDLVPAVVARALGGYTGRPKED